MLQVGDKVGDYEIIGVLGRGGMGKVFRVRNLISDRVEAMKIVLPDLEADAELADRFLREIRVHASLDHPNIARLSTAFRAGDQVFMILEFVDGVGLDEKLRGHPLSPSLTIRYVDQILSALGYAHDRGIVHRDLKPGNILVTPARVVKLTDFGIAQAANARKLTRTGMALGSLYYMAPEQITSGAVDGRSDLYALGVTFFEMVTGQRPIKGDSEYSLMRAQVEQMPVAPIELNPGLPARISAIILKALAKDPAARFQTAKEFQSALYDAGYAAQAQSGGTAPGRPATGATMGSQVLIEPAKLARVEALLLLAVGPIAKHLVARAAKQHATIGELCRNLADQISVERERDAFLRACDKDLGGVITAPVQTIAVPSPAEPGRTISTNAPPPDPALLQTVKRQLAVYLGPIAGVMVDRTAKKARDWHELVEMLAAEIPSKQDRAKFLAAAGK
jgi:serine/threonine-protein kinase